MSNKKSIWWLIPLFAGLTACGSSDTAVRLAAQQRWNAMIAGDFDAAYPYYTDAFKSTVSLEHFKRRSKGVGLWNKAEVKTVSCDEANKRCQADIEVTVAMKMRGLPKPVETSEIVQETWVKEGVFSDWRYIKN